MVNVQLMDLVEQMRIMLAQASQTGQLYTDITDRYVIYRHHSQLYRDITVRSVIYRHHSQLYRDITDRQLYTDITVSYIETSQTG